jgi:hypothetical protein
VRLRLWSAADRAPSRRVVAIAAAFVALFVSAAQLAVALHFVLISHEMCSEHGRFEHRSHRVVALSLGKARPSAPALETASDSGSHHECELIARPGERLSLVATRPLQSLRIAVSFAAALGRSAVALHSSVAVLSLAPKQGPPA